MKFPRFWHSAVRWSSYGTGICHSGICRRLYQSSQKRNLGLTAGQKMVMQILIAAIYLIILYLAGILPLY